VQLYNTLLSSWQYNPYFVESYGWFETTESVFITMEFFPHGDLQEHLSKASIMPEAEVQQIAFQVLEGLQFMHDNGFAHRDLKPSVSIVLQLPITTYCVKEKLTTIYRIS
jgi:serine/threonine protein kinase